MTYQDFQDRLKKNAYDRRYNVEYRLNDGTYHTFSNVLVSYSSDYVYFESEEYGLDIIKTDRITTMTCIDRKGDK